MALGRARCRHSTRRPAPALLRLAAAALPLCGGTEADLTVLTWNQGLGGDSSSLRTRLQGTDAQIAAVCQQEATAGFEAPDGWEQAFQDRQLGMTKPTSMTLANIYLTVLRRSGSNVALNVPRSGGEKVSLSGKGSVWAELRVEAGENCSSVVVVCVHLPTEPDEREAALGEVLEDVSEEYKPNTACDDDGQMPAKECWDDLTGVLITGDLNYRLDGRLRQPAPSHAWLVQALEEARWQDMWPMDTARSSALLTAEAGFSCLAPRYLPTYKVHDAAACRSGDVQGCYLPDGQIPMKGDEMQIGWLDRTCWHARNGSGLAPLSDEALHGSEGESDHVPVESVFRLRVLGRSCPAASGKASGQPSAQTAVLLLAALLALSAVRA